MAVNNLGLGLLLEAKDLASGVLGRFSSQLTGVVDKTTEAGKRVQAGMKQAGIGLSIFAAGAVGLAALGPASDKATEFGFQVARIRTVIDETALSTDNAKKSTLGLAATYGISALQQADGLYETISAGISDVKQATDLLAVANEFAVGGTTGLAGSVDVLTSAVNTYADTGLTARQASDLMFTAIAAGKTTAEQLSQSLGEVAPTAHAAGVSFAELQASIAALTVQGIKTPQAVTGLNAMLSNLMKPSSDATKEAKRLGIQFDATALKSLGLKGVLAQLAGNTKVNDNTFTELFGSVDGVKAALALTAGGGAKMNEILAQMGTSSGATAKAFDIMSNTTKFQESRFAALRENALILLGDALEPLKVGVLKVVNSIVEGFNSLPAPVRNFMVQAFAVASVLLTVVGGALALKGAITAGGAALSALGLSMSGALAAVLPMVGVLALVGLAFYGLKRAYDQNIGGFAERVDAAVGKVKLAFSALGQLFSSGAFSGSVMDELNKAENSGVKNFAINVFVWVARIQNFFAGVGRGFDAALSAAKPAFDAFLKALESLVGGFGGLTSAVDAGTGPAFDAAGVKGEDVGRILGKLATTALKVATVALQIASALLTLGGGITSTVGQVGGLNTVLYALEIVMVALAFKSILSASSAIVTLGASAWASVGGIGGLTAALAALRGMSISTAMASAATALRGFVTSTAASLGPIGALTAALTALYVAFDQASKLAKEWDSNSSSQIWTKFKNDLGIDNDEMTRTLQNERSGILTGDEYDRYQEKRAAEAAKKKAQKDSLIKFVAGATPLPSDGGSAVAPAKAQAEQASALAAPSAQLAATVVAQGAQKPPQVSTQVIVMIDGENIPATSTTRTATANGVPVAPAGT